MSEQKPDPGAQPTPQPQAPESDPEPGAANTEVFASAEFATGPKSAAAPEGFAEPEPVADTEPEAIAEPEPAPEPTPEPEPESEPAATVVVPQQAAAVPPSWPVIPGAESPVAYGHPAEQPPARKARRRTGLVVGLGVGYAVLAAGTAFGVIAGASPAPVDVTAVNASVYAAASASASGTGSAGPQSSTSPSAVASSAAPTTAPPTKATPTSTVTGTVSDGTHHGDLRYFLLPPPQGPSSVQGDPDGTKESLDDVVHDFYGGSSSVSGYLRQEGFKSACTLTYQDSTIGANVTIELIQFGSSNDASAWESAFSDASSGTKRISVPGESGAEAWSASSDGGHSLLGVYREGDTFFQVQIYGDQSIPASDLGKLISAQHSRLANG